MISLPPVIRIYDFILSSIQNSILEDWQKNQKSPPDHNSADLCRSCEHFEGTLD